MGTPPQAFVSEMPRPFRDSLPLRAERFRDRPAQLREAPEFGYADVESWLKAEPSVRRPLMQRWRVKARTCSAWMARRRPPARRNRRAAHADRQ